MGKTPDKSYKRSMQAHEWTVDKMPDKKREGRKFKRRERQRGKKQIKKALEE